MSRIDRRIDKLAVRLNWLLPEGTVIVGGLKGMLHDIRRIRERIKAVEVAHLRHLAKHDDGLVDSRVDQIISLKERINALELAETVECEKCGCLLNKGTAIRGESVIEGVSGDIPWHLCKYDGQTGCAIRPDVTETIREVYYCKVHQPKGKK